MQHLSRQRMQSADGQCETTGRIGSDQGDTGWQNNGHGRTSGVGKSSMTNAMYPDAEMATGLSARRLSADGIRQDIRNYFP